MWAGRCSPPDSRGSPAARASHPIVDLVLCSVTRLRVMHPSSDTGKAILHWSQWLWPGPRRVFSAQEMARAGAQPWPKAINHYVLANVITLLAINYAEIPSGLAPGLAAGALLLTLLSLWVAQQLWAQPTRLRLNLYTLAAGLGLVGCALGLRWLLGREAAEVHLLSYAAIVLVSCSAWWMLSLMRVQQIEARLRELDDQAQQARLARRLATAQIQPHFLFNTLASLQHWVDTRDPRAGSTLRAFTQYLRATLPMFERESHSLAQELQIVRSYLEIMQARLGERLVWSVSAAPALSELALPPGALLTLVENAIVHGIEPALRGGAVDVRATLNEAQGWATLEVQDSGQGMTAERVNEGLGLSNTRNRLRQLHGEAARLELQPQDPGCLARIMIPSSREQAA